MTLEYGDRVYCEYNGVKYGRGYIMRIHGDPIGEVGPDMRKARVLWAKDHDIQVDTICKKNCLDVCIAFNKKASE